MTALPTLTANLYVGNQRLDAARKVIVGSKVIVAGLQEMRTHEEFTVPGFRKYQCEDDEFGGNVAMLLSRDPDVEYQGHGFQQMTDRIGPKPGYDAPRWLAWVDFRYHGTEWSVFGAHLPVVSRKSTPNPATSKAAAAFEDYSIGMFALAEAKARQGRVPVILGDLNDQPHDGVKPWRWLPTSSLPRHGYEFERNGVDYVAAGMRAAVGNRQVIAQSRTGSDHDWLKATVRT